MSSAHTRSIFDLETRSGLIDRINRLSEQAPAQWGTMTVNQMLKHCTLFEDMMLGKTKYKRALLGYLFGKIALRDVFKDKPLGKSTPTLPELKVKDTPDFALQKKQWMDLLEEYGHFTNTAVMHPFFGKISREQIGVIAFKHTDHHLRQFGG